MTKGRFIAGAVCPDCRELDKIMVRKTPAGDERHCVACGFSDQARDLVDEAQDLTLLPAGKLDAIATARRVGTGSIDESQQPVRIISPPGQTDDTKKAD